MKTNNFEPYYYGNTSKCDKDRTDEFIEKNKDKKLWSLALYFDTKRLAKYQRSKSLFWEGYNNDFSLCRTSDLSKYNGLYTFEEAFKLFKEFPIQNYELVRLNFNMEYYMSKYCKIGNSNEHLILTRGCEVA